jgi:hypothetical protein
MEYRLHKEDEAQGGACWSIHAVDRPVGKLLARSVQVPEDEFLLRVERIVGRRAEVTYSGSGGLAEIGPHWGCLRGVSTRWMLCSSQRTTTQTSGMSGGL